MGRDYLMEQAEYLKKDLGKHNISQTLFQRLKELIIELIISGSINGSSP